MIASVTDGGGDTIRVLHVDDEPDLAELTATYLTREDDRFSIDTVKSASDGLQLLSEGQFDCVISDYDMPGRNGVEFLKAVRDAYPDLPFILYTGKGSEEVASNAISAGVTDYLQKESGTDQYTILANRVRNVVERHWLKRKAEQTEAKLREVADQREEVIERVTDAIVEVDADWTFTFVNEQAEDLYNMSAEYLRGRHFWDVFEDAKDTRFETEYRTVMETREPTSFVEYFSQLDGWFDINAYPKDDGGIAFYFVEVTEHRERQQELEDERKFISEALDTLDDGFFVVGTSGELQRWNDRVTEVTGYSDDELTEMAAIEIFPEDERERMTSAIQTTLQDGSAEVEADIRAADGARIPYEFVARRLTDCEGEVTGITGIGRDTSERKAREREYERVLDLLNHTEAVADVGGWEIEPESRAVFWSENLFEMLGWETREEPPLEAALDVYIEEDRPRVTEAVEDALAAGDPFDVEARYERRDGEIRWFEISGDPSMEAGEVVALRGAVHDITAHKQREEELTQAREEYEALFNGMNDAGWVLDLDGEVLAVNTAAVERSGYPRAELVGMRPHDITAGHDDEEITALIEKMPTDEIQVVETVRVTKSGEHIPIEISSSLITYSD